MAYLVTKPVEATRVDSANSGRLTLAPGVVIRPVVETNPQPRRAFQHEDVVDDTSLTPSAPVLLFEVTAPVDMAGTRVEVSREAAQGKLRNMPKLLIPDNQLQADSDLLRDRLADADNLTSIRLGTLRMGRDLGAASDWVGAKNPAWLQRMNLEYCRHPNLTLEVLRLPSGGDHLVLVYNHVPVVEPDSRGARK